MNKNNIILVFCSMLIFVVIFIIALMVGQYSINVGDFYKSIATNDESLEIAKSIIINLRLPRTIMAALTGMSLSLSGLLYQEMFQNKLTSPDLLGVSSGASVGAAIAILLNLSSVWISSFSFILGIITVILTIFISKLFHNDSPITLVLAGIITSGFMSALLALIKYFSDPTSTLATISYWLMGSFENTTMNQNLMFLPCVLISNSLLIMLSWRINIIALGKDESKTKGLNYDLYKTLVIVIATLLTSVSVSFNGTISWVGLVIPHLVRLIVGRDTRKTIPLTIIYGGIFMIIVDVFARTFTIQEIPISAVTGLFGTIIFIIIVIFKRGSIYVY